MTHAGRVHRTEAGHSVTTLELFFDLVFVFALTQVTALLAADLTALGAVRGFLVLAVLWWSWMGYSWLTNFVRADDGLVRLILLAVMGVMLVIALAIPDAYDEAARAPQAPLVLAIGYLLVRAAHLWLFSIAGRDDPALARSLRQFSVPVVAGVALMIAGAVVDGTARIALWTAGLAVEFVVALLRSSGAWQINAPRHFAERHGLIVIIALGESIVAIGAGVAGIPLSWPIVVMAALGLILVAELWWAYFDLVSLVAERRLASTTGNERTTLARDAYTYLHFPMVVGIVFAAVGLKKGLTAAGEANSVPSIAEIPAAATWALFGGVAVYLLAHVGFRLRMVRSLGRHRPVAAAALVVLAAPASSAPAPAQLGIVALVLAAMIVLETRSFGEFRARMRHT